MIGSKQASTYLVALFAMVTLSGSAMAGAPDTAEIPTLSEWGFVIMGIGLLSLGVRFLRRRGASDPR